MMSRRLLLSLLWVIVTLAWMLPVPCTRLRRAVQSTRRSPSTFERDAWCHTIQLVLHTCSGVLLGLGSMTGTVDADELNRITGKMKEAGIDQEGMNYVIGQLQSPMATDAIVAGGQGRLDLAAQVYSVSLMAIEVDAPAERAYLDRLAASMGLAPEVAQNIEQLVGMPPR